MIFRSCKTYNHHVSGAAVLIYVLDIMSEKPDDDLEGFKECLNAIAEYAENSKVFVLVHKMDLLEEDAGHPPGHKQERFEAKCVELKEIADENKIQVLTTFLITVFLIR